MPIYSLGDMVPEIHPSVWIAPSADIIGDVTIGEGSTIWFGAVLRGDQAPIIIGEKTNIQDNCVIHSCGDFHVIVGDRCTVGHGVILHGCRLMSGVCVGMGSELLDGVQIGPDSLIGAGSVVTKSFAGGNLILGVPAAIKRGLREEEIEKNRFFRADRYVEAGKHYRNQLKKW
jgi:carbonic anhydrase/acetyltransferase-like protein (isoleucine patch superfamily)